MLYGTALEVMGIETGASVDFDVTGLGGVTDVVNTFADIAAGGPQKRERAAKYARDAAIAEKEAALAMVEAARIAQSTPARAPGLMATLAAPSPVFGLSWGTVVAVGAGLAVAGYLVLA